MALDEVHQAIRREREREAQAVLTATQAEATQIIAAARERVAQDRARFDAETQAMMITLERKELASANAKAKTITLEAKRAAIDEVFQETATALAQQQPAAREGFLRELVKEAHGEIPVARIRCAPRDETLVRALAPNATVKADQRISGGIIANSADNTVAIDLSYETLLGAARERELTTLTRILFSD